MAEARVPETLTLVANDARSDDQPRRMRAARSAQSLPPLRPLHGSKTSSSPSVDAAPTSVRNLVDRLRSGMPRGLRSLVEKSSRSGPRRFRSGLRIRARFNQQRQVGRRPLLRPGVGPAQQQVAQQAGLAGTGIRPDDQPPVITVIDQIEGIARRLGQIPAAQAASSGAEGSPWSVWPRSPAAAAAAPWAVPAPAGGTHGIPAPAGARRSARAPIRDSSSRARIHRLQLQPTITPEHGPGVALEVETGSATDAVVFKVAAMRSTFWESRISRKAVFSRTIARALCS